ncbi:MAG TPA: DUF1572 family protein [Acidobacteriaceae bacterium]|nr:DUF1572 family protein [Acidobacteriaceae bacterium]
MSLPQSGCTSLFLEFSRNKLIMQYWPRLKACVESLTDEQVWWRPNEASNSVGNLMLHLNGNMRQWIVAAFRREEDRRNRPAEFAEHGPMPRAKLLENFGATVREADEVLRRLTEADLLSEYDIQGYHVHGLDAVYQVIEHFGLHFGQIAYITKMLRAEDLGFYKELNTTGRAWRSCFAGEDDR